MHHPREVTRVHESYRKRDDRKQQRGTGQSESSTYRPRSRCGAAHDAQQTDERVARREETKGGLDAEPGQQHEPAQQRSEHGSKGVRQGEDPGRAHLLAGLAVQRLAQTREQDAGQEGDGEHHEDRVGQRRTARRRTEEPVERSIENDDQRAGEQRDDRRCASEVLAPRQHSAGQQPAEADAREHRGQHDSETDVVSPHEQQSETEPDHLQPEQDAAR